MKWPLLEGLVLVEEPLNVYVRLECYLSFKTALGSSRKVLYQQDLHLREFEQQQKCKYCFKFDLGQRALPPSFVFNLEEEYGIHWTVSGIIGKPVEDGFLPLSQANLSIQIGYRYSQKTLEYLNPHPIPMNYRNKILNFTKPPIIHCSLSNYILQKPNLQTSLLLDLDLEIQNIKILLKQHILVQFLNTHQIHYKHEQLLSDDRPSPKYDQKQIVPLDFSLLASKMASTLDLGNRHELLLQDLVPSTTYCEPVHGVSTVTVEYHLMVIVTVQDHFKDLVCLIPIVISNPELNARPDNLLTRDQFAPILSELYEDLKHSLPILDDLSSSWKSFRKEAFESDRMVTASSDHALILLEFMDSLEQQILVFIDLLQHPTPMIPWLRDSTPFNLFILELELLARASPSGLNTIEPTMVVEMLLISVKSFFEESFEIIKCWLESKTMSFDKWKSSCLQVRNLLDDIAQGKDTEEGNDK
ncbi:hypothetical protein EDD86DRAFT_272436 [Gorgonomyces haynaldii]|nr:hypothetical protein EDD86DRAFT_272436 [Gorgonomyces haynaldii]